MSADIHLCAADEIDSVMRFIGKYWAKGHVLAHDRALMDWQHRRPDGSYNFVVATCEDDPEPLAVLGFIPSSRFDPELAGHETVWLALWKVRPESSSAGLGLAVLRFMTAMHPGADAGVVGIGPAEHIGMYRALGFATGHLTQYYMLDIARTDFRIANVPTSTGAMTAPRGGGRLTPLPESDLLSVARRVERSGAIRNPRKTARYFRNRFLAHPVYSYTVYLAEGESGAGLLATRLATHDGRNVLRLVDFLGSEALFAELGGAVQSLVSETGAEYADIWNFGFEKETFERAGFLPLDPNGAVVIPNYFEPFVQRNGHISFALRSSAGDATAIFRADGDQDRPNLTAAQA